MEDPFRLEPMVKFPSVHAAIPLIKFESYFFDLMFILHFGPPILYLDISYNDITVRMIMLFTIVLQSYNLHQFGDHETNRDLRVLSNALIVDSVDNSSL